MPIIMTKGLVFKHISYPDLAVEPDQMTFLSGPSGCGKSTLFRLINATLTPSSGTLFFDGQELAHWDTLQLRQHILLVNQSVFLFDGTIEDNFRIYREYREAEPISRDVVEKYLSLCCADFPLDKDVHLLSGGERQRVFNAICLAFQPQMLLLDEPTSALDEDTAHRFFTQLKAHCQEKHITPMVVSHDPQLPELFGDALIHLRAPAAGSTGEAATAAAATSVADAPPTSTSAAAPSLTKGGDPS